MSKRLAWGILGTGRIAGVFAKGLAESKTGDLVAVGSRTAESAERFGAEHGVARRHGVYEALLADPEVEAVYISTPHPMHAEWAIKTAEAGKHVLCEKPLTLNYPEAMAVVEAARENDVFLMEAFMYRCHPQTAKLVELVREGVIGEVRVVQATFSFNAGEGLEGRLFEPRQGGGGILDVGCYATSMARLMAGAAVGKPFDDPVEVKGTARIGKTGVDDYAVASLKFASGIVAQVATGVRVQQENVARIFGSKGWIFVPEPWMPGRDGRVSQIIVHRAESSEPEKIEVAGAAGLYTLEADTVARYIEQRQAAPPAMTWDDTLGNMKTLDAWRASIGLVYDSEKPEAKKPPVHGRLLAVRADSKMRYGQVQGFEKPISRIVSGVMVVGSGMPHISVMFDDYFERGGNCFDTAYTYGGGVPERLLGQWIRNRGIREKVVIIAKGAHSPSNRPEMLRPQLVESLERMQTDYTDIHLAHRDNPDIPVGEWADAWNELIREGLIRAYGGSNWTLARVQALNEYARAKGLVGMAAVSNQFSLARMVDPVWGGCLSASDAESRAWFERTQIALFPWSSQARGFFTERASAENLSEAELVRCWYAEDNFARRARAEELAVKRAVAPTAVALAYVLSQPFPTFPLIGPQSVHEQRVSLKALEVELSPDEVKWLNLEV